MKGQLSIEFTIVFVGMLLIVASVTYPLYNQARADAEKITKLSEAREASNILANALNTLYANGPGSRQTIEYWLPKGVVGIYANMEEDGIITSDGSVFPNGRLDVRADLDLDGDGEWDNKREAVVLVDTLIPSVLEENGENRDENWVVENCITIQDWNMSFDPTSRTHHRVTLEYQYGPTIEQGMVLANRKLNDGRRFRFTTILSGSSGTRVRVRVDAENNPVRNHGREGDLIKVRNFELRSGRRTSVRTNGQGTDFTLTLTLEGITVRVIVQNGWVRVELVTMVAPPYPRQIVISDVITERV